MHCFTETPMASRSTLKITLPQVLIPKDTTAGVFEARYLGPRFAKVNIKPSGGVSPEQAAKRLALETRQLNPGVELPMVLITETVL